MKYRIDVPAVVVPARVATLLTRLLELDRRRVAWRGQDREVDEVLGAWHEVVLAYRTTVVTRTCDETASDDDKPSQVVASSATRGSAAVARLAGVTTAAVTLAARKGQLDGERIDGRWRFTTDAVAAWLASRKQAAA